MRMLTEHGPPPSGVVMEHVALAGPNGPDKAFVRLNMISSADGGSAVGGKSGGLGNREDHAVFGALRDHADAVLVGMSTVVAEHYQAPKSPELRVYVIAKTPDVSGAPELFASGRATLVLPEDAGPGPEGVPELRAGTGGQVDLPKLASLLAGKVVVMEGGPTLAGQMVALGLVDELFLTVAPRVILEAPLGLRTARTPTPRPGSCCTASSTTKDSCFYGTSEPQHSTSRSASCGNRRLAAGASRRT